MPRINLLPVRALAKLDRAKHELLLAGLFNLALACALALAYQLQASRLASLHEAEAQATHQLTQLADQVQRTKALDERVGRPIIRTVLPASAASRTRTTWEVSGPTHGPT